MIPVENSPFAPNERMLRQFAGLWIVCFSALAVLQELRHERHAVAVALGTLAITVGPLGLVWPRLIKPIFVGWMWLAYPIGWIVSRVVLGALFFGMFTPFAVLFRLFGRDVLGLKRHAEGSTYWRAKPSATKASYFRQF